ncbi:ABC transporter ATP-binding protein [Aliiroseovarius sp. YM-037]|uniref:ABC transporter ATP-binding protein n=1 Tax=Aliiroseovarius sp. YM-037 TaxID=3341728 RepID=UPI003A808229
MPPIIEINDLSKTYDDGFEALKSVNLEVREGEILALLGPNGAGKTTLISIVCGLVNATAGSVFVGGHDVVRDFRGSRSMIGLVPQEIALEPFQSVIDSLRFTRGLFGKKSDPKLLEDVLRKLSLWDKRDTATKDLSGGMKRRVLIAKALCHEPRILFLDEPTAGVDVELRKEMWDVVRQLKADGVTIILTTHYIEEAEAIADRIGIIREGALLVVEEKTALIERFGQRQMRIELMEPVESLPKSLNGYDLERAEDGKSLVYSYSAIGERTGIASLLSELSDAGIVLRDVHTHQSSLEDIMVDFLKDRA